MRQWEKLTATISNSKSNFDKVFKEVIKELGITIKAFSKLSKIPESTLYKIASGQRRDPQLSNIQRIIHTVKKLEIGEYGSDINIAIVTTRPALESIKDSLKIKGKKVRLLQYPATEIGEILVQGMRAERDGADAILCGPVAAYTLEKVVSVPIVSLKVSEEDLKTAIEDVVSKKL